MVTCQGGRQPTRQGTATSDPAKPPACKPPQRLWSCDSSVMPELPSLDPPERRPKSPKEDFDRGRLTSVVHIMRGRSPFSHLGILDLEAGTLSLRDAKGRQLFAAPAETVQARPARRRFYETSTPGIEVHANDRWWFLVPHVVPIKYQRRSTRELVAHYHAREQVPRPGGLSEEDYLRLVKNPRTHQVLWGGCWLETLARTRHS
jgi:hypothetical protein